MKRRLRLKSTTKLAIFSTITVMSAVFTVSALIWLTIADPSRPDVLHALQLMPAALLFVAPFSYLISSLIIDRTLNPIRVMIEKVKAVGNRDFGGRIAIPSSDEELVEYVSAFNQMSAKLDDYIEKQKRFISDASHELVTPITVIAGHADMLLRWGKDDPQTLKNGLTIIKKEAFAMNELIEDLLFFARSDNSRITYARQTLALTSLLDACAAEQRLLHPDFSIIFNASRPLYIHADPDAMKRVLRILFANSVKYSHEMKQIVITLCQDQQTNRPPEKNEQALSLRFSDAGIGIAPEHLTKIFDRFYRVDDSRTRQTGGTGLGLSIAKEILQAHGYTISAESELDAGTTIVIRMPCATAP